MTTPTRPHRLSKSRFVAGCQCHKLLWWRVHEPKAEELQRGGSKPIWESRPKVANSGVGSSAARFGSRALMRARSAGRRCPKGRVGEWG